MKIGLISDVHANVLALEAALHQLEAQGVDQIICLGDLVGYGPAPNETIDLVRSKEIICTLGSADEKVAYGFAGGGRQGVGDQTLAWTREVIEEDHVNFLRKLPAHYRMNTPQGRLRALHGTVEQEMRVRLDQDAAELQKLLEAQRCKILAVGNSHVPFAKQLSEGWLINPGSVGLSLNGEPGADFVVLTITDEGVTVHMDKVEYDFATVAFDIIAWGLPKSVAEAVQYGRMSAG